MNENTSYFIRRNLVYLYIFLHTYVNVYLHILHNHIGIHIPAETKVTRVMLVIFLSFLWQNARQRDFGKEVLTLPLSVRVKSIIRIQGRGRRSTASWWHSFTVRNQRDEGWGYLTYPFSLIYSVWKPSLWKGPDLTSAAVFIKESRRQFWSQAGSMQGGQDLPALLMLGCYVP